METVEDIREQVQYSLGLVYGEVLVSVMNTCGQQSQSAGINIPAAGTFKLGIQEISVVPCTQTVFHRSERPITPEIGKNYQFSTSRHKHFQGQRRIFLS